jgi:hypothetical protein
LKAKSLGVVVSGRLCKTQGCLYWCAGYITSVLVKLGKWSPGPQIAHDWETVPNSFYTHPFTLLHVSMECWNVMNPIP